MVNNDNLTLLEVEEMINSFHKSFLIENQTIFKLLKECYRNTEIADIFLRNIKKENNRIFRVYTNENVILEGFEALKYFVNLNFNMLISDLVNIEKEKLNKVLPDVKKLSFYYTNVNIPIKKIEKMIDIFKRELIKEDITVLQFYRIANMSEDTKKIADLLLKNIKINNEIIFKTEIKKDTGIVLEGYELIRFYANVIPDLKIKDLIRQDKEIFINILPDSNKLAKYHFFSSEDKIIIDEEYSSKR